MVRGRSGGQEVSDSPLRVKSQKYSELDIGRCETCWDLVGVGPRSFCDQGFGARA